MVYKLNITEHADSLLNALLYHLLYSFKNEQAAGHLLDEIDKIYVRLEENPLQFPLSKDTCLASKGYREAVVPHMDYIVVFRVETNTVHIMGVFHQLENYRKKL